MWPASDKVLPIPGVYGLNVSLCCRQNIQFVRHQRFIIIRDGFTPLVFKFIKKITNYFKAIQCLLQYAVGLCMRLILKQLSWCSHTLMSRRTSAQCRKWRKNKLLFLRWINASDMWRTNGRHFSGMIVEMKNKTIFKTGVFLYVQTTIIWI